MKNEPPSKPGPSAPAAPASTASHARDDATDTASRCANCGATVTWDPDQDALSCEHCGQSRAVPRGEERIVERTLEEAVDAERGLGLEVRVARCSNCAARVAFGSDAIATSCAFCGSPSVLAEEARRAPLRPESVIPLDVGRAGVEEAFRTWLRKLWFRPSALKRTKHFDARGIYIPAWTFDCTVDSDWSADAGHYYWVTVPKLVMVKGKPRMRMERERRVRWEPAFGVRRDVYDDEQVLASRGVEPGLAVKLGSFDTSALVPYRPDYLAGWQAEEYSLELDDGWKLAHERVLLAQRARCSRDVPGDTQRRLRVRSDVHGVRWKHVLLPLWSLTYTFGGKPYAVLVHGQSGRIVGRAPLSVAKILLAVVAALAIAGSIALAFAL